MKQIFYLFLLFTLLLSNNAYASCIKYLYGKDLVRKADIIFIGQAVGVGLSEPNKYGQQEKYTNFQVIESLKGKEQEEFNIFYGFSLMATRGDVDLPPTSPNKKYIVYAFYNKDKNKYSYTGCTTLYLNIDTIKYIRLNRTAAKTLVATYKKYPWQNDYGIKSTTKNYQKEYGLINTIWKFVREIGFD